MEEFKCGNNEFVSTACSCNCSQGSCQCDPDTNFANCTLKSTYMTNHQSTFTIVKG